MSLLIITTDYMINRIAIIASKIVLLLICVLPARADDFVLDIRESWPETESCLPLVELECPQIIGFLRECIFPIYRNNNGDKDYDRIYLKISENENMETEFQVILYLHIRQELKETDYILRNGYEYSVAVIDGIRIIIISKKSCSLVKRNKSGKVCFKALKDFYAINDACAEWNFVLKDNNLVFIGFLDWGVSWLKKLGRETYDPGFRPIKKVYKHKRKFSLFREAGIPSILWLPDSMKINEPYKEQ